jgi:hypothetical protein
MSSVSLRRRPVSTRRPAACLAAAGVFASFLTGCFAPIYKVGEWPEGLPQESFYRTIYSADEFNRRHQTEEEYFAWVLRFYQGYQIIPGWQTQERTLAKILTDEEFTVLAPQLSYLAQIASGEWAKSNEARRVDNDMLQLLGGVLRKAAKEHRAGEALDRITRDLQSVLDGSLAPDDVTAERYEDLTSRVEK